MDIIFVDHSSKKNNNKLLQTQTLLLHFKSHEFSAKFLAATIVFLQLN